MLAVCLLHVLLIYCMLAVPVYPVQVTGFLDKNKDTLNADLIDVMLGSGNTLLSLIGGSIYEESEGQRSGQTVSSRFSQQLKELITELDATGLHFIRCIKPNSALAANQFDQQLVLGQLRCCGVLEVARVSRAGFPTRYLHADFVTRYRIMLPKEQQAALQVGGAGGAGGAYSRCHGLWLACH